MIPNRRLLSLLVIAVATAISPAIPATEQKFPPPGPGTVDIVARDYQFEMPSRTTAGWTTFRFHNAGMAPHFAVLNKLPEGKTLDDYKTEVGGAFEHAMDAIVEDKGEKARGFEILGKELPAWFGEVRQMGGPGLTNPGDLSVAMCKLTPGNYVVECYIKTPDNRFHGSLGMLKTLVVTDGDSGGSEPGATARIALYNDRMELSGDLQKGRNVVAVEFKEHPAGGLGNDVHVVKLEDDAQLATVVRWLDWSNLDGMTHTIPGRFFGGTEEMPAGNTAYMVLNLEPGDYALVSEPAAAAGLLHRFSIK